MGNRIRRFLSSGAAGRTLRITLGSCIILVALGIFCFPLLANDPPHNDDSGVSCGECHGNILFETDPAGLSEDALKDTYNDMCLRCHTLYDDGTYHGNTGPKVDAHTAAVTQTGKYEFTTCCVDCHHPHYQTPQFWYGRKYYRSNYELAYGAGTAAPHPTEADRTIITYTLLTVKSGWTVAQLAEKTSLGRGAMLLPNRNSPYNSRIIEAISGDASGGTITVKGGATISSAGFAIAYGQAIKRDIPYASANGRPVEFFDRQGSQSYGHNDGAGGDIDGDTVANDSSPNGICQVCHTQTSHWKKDGSKAAVGVHAGMDDGVNCMVCHSHAGGFKVSFADHADFIDPTCSSVECHSGEPIQDIHKSTCSYCHLNLPAYIPLATHGQPLPGNLGISNIVDGTQQAYNTPVTCGDCHGGGHAAAHDFARINKPTCQSCHLDNVVNEHLGQRGYTCNTCHQSAVQEVIDAIALGKSNTIIYCNDCHDYIGVSPSGEGNFIKEAHHETLSAATGNCSDCHVIGRGVYAPVKMPCLKCHGAGEMFDPQREGVEKHQNGPALTLINDSRVCFSCHLEHSQGYVAGVTPAVTPLHSLLNDPPFLDKYTVLVPDPAYPGKGTLNINVPEKHRSGHDTRPHGNYAMGMSTDVRVSRDMSWPDEMYSRVSVDYGGSSYLVPSYEGDGGGGKSSESGNLTVTINPAAVVASGAQWREDGKDWKNSGESKIGLTARNHLVEGKLVQGWATPPAISVSITPGTMNVSLTYEACDADADLSIAHVGNGSVFTWYSPTQQEEFVVSGWTPSWNIDCVLDTDGATGFTVVPTGTDSCRIEKKGSTTAGTYNFVLQATGSSCPDNSATYDMTVTVTDSGTGSPDSPQYYGSIDGTIDSLPYSIPGAKNPAVFHVSGNRYGVVYRVDVAGATYLDQSILYIETFTVDGDGMISGTGATFNLGTTYGSIDVAKVSETIAATTIAVVHRATSYTPVLQTYLVASDGTSVTPVGALSQGNSMKYQPVRITHLFNNTYAVSYGSNTIRTVSINASGNITSFSLEWSPGSGIGPGIEHVSGDIYAVLSWANGIGEVMTFRINVSGGINKTPISTFNIGEIGSNGDIKRLRADSDIFVLTHGGYPEGNKFSGGAYLKTLRIGNDGSITPSIISSRLLESLMSIKNEILPIADNVVGVNFGREGCYGTNYTDIHYFQTFYVSDEGKITPIAIDGFTKGSEFDLLHAAGDIYFSANDGGVATIRIFTEPALTLDADLSFTAGNNCNEVDVTVTIQPGAHSGPYYCDFDWGDGTPVTENVECGSGFISTHNFSGTEAYSLVTWKVRDNGGYSMRYPNPRTNAVSANRDLDSDGLCAADPCPNDSSNDSLDNDGICGGEGFGGSMTGDNDPCPSESPDDADGDEYCAGAGFQGPMLGDNDNCLGLDNDQSNLDGDEYGDDCDTCPGDSTNDADNDSICAGAGFSGSMTADNDNCPLVSNPPEDCDLNAGTPDEQCDQDEDGIGDDCDNCLTVANTDQADLDNDTIGDACDPEVIVPDITVTDTISPPGDFSLPFGETVIGASIDQTITIQNDGNIDLVLRDMAGVDALTAPFSIINDNCSLQTLVPAASCTFDLRYAPTSSGSFDDSFDIASDDPDEDSITITVSGSAVEPVYAYLTVDNKISKLRIYDNTIIATSGVIFSFAKGITVSPDDSSVYAASYNNKSVVAVRTSDLGSQIITVGSSPWMNGVAFNPNGNYVYAARWNEGAISVIRTLDNAEIDSIEAGSYPYGVAVSPDSSYIYVVNSASDDVSVIRAFDREKVATVPVGDNPHWIAVSPDSSRIYVTNFNDNTVSVIQASDHTVTAIIPVGGDPEGIVFSTDGAFAYVANKSSGSISVIDTASNTVVATVPVGASPTGIDVTPEGSYVYVLYASGVAIMSTADNTIVEVLPMPPPTAIGSFIVDTDLSVPQPDITVTDTTGATDNQAVEFGPELLETDTSRAVTLTNSGTADLVIGSIAGSNTLVAPFATINDTCSNQTLAPGASCTFYVRFTPTDKIDYVDSLDIPSNDPDENPTSVWVTGRGVNSDIIVDDPFAPTRDLDMPFGYRITNNAVTQTVTISSNGEGDLILGSIASSNNPLSAPFTIVNNTCSDQRIDPGATCTFDVEFLPTSAGLFSDSFDIQTNDPDESLLTLKVSGTGMDTGSDIDVRDSSFFPYDLNIYYEKLGIGSVLDETVTVRNNGNEDLIIYDLPDSSNLLAAPFSIINDTCSGVTLVPAASCTFDVRFTPTETGRFWETFAIRSNTADPNEEYTTITVSGVGFQIPYAYIANWGTNNVSVIQVQDSRGNPLHEVVDTIAVGSRPYGVAISRDGSHVYVSNWVGATVSVIQTSDNTVVATIPVCTSGPKGLDVTPDGSHVYVACGFGGLDVIRTSDNSVLTNVLVGNSSSGIAASHDGNYVYVPITNTNNIAVVQTSDNTVVDNIVVGSSPHNIILSADGTMAYVSHYDVPTIYVFNTSDTSLKVGYPLGVFPRPFGLAVTPDKSRLYVTSIYNNNSLVPVVQISPWVVLDKVYAGTDTQNIAITPDGQYVYVTNYDDDTVSVINTANNTLETTVNVGGAPRSLGQFISGRAIPPVTVEANFSHSEGGSCNQIDFNVDVFEPNTEYTGPYECDFDWGDGTSETGVTCNTTHSYMSPLETTYDVTWTVRSSEGYSIESPNPRTESILVCPNPNLAPSPVRSIKTLCSNYGVTVTDSSTDSDYYNYDSSPWRIQIKWGDFSGGPEVITEEEIVLTDSPNPQEYTHNYPGPGNYMIMHGVKDNASNWVWSPAANMHVVSDGTDTDNDGICDGVDACPGFDDGADADGDGVADGCDACPGFDDAADTDGDGVADGCDPCQLDNPDDTDNDGVCDSADVCPGFDDNVDGDGDGVADGCDTCPLDNPDDTDSDGVCDSADVCQGFDDNGTDTDGDGVPDGCDTCAGGDDAVDTDDDGIPDDCDHTIILNYTGAAQTALIPANATNIQFTLKGGGGGGGHDYVGPDSWGDETDGEEGHLVITPSGLTNVTLTIYVGGGGLAPSCTGCDGAPGGWGYPPGSAGGHSNYIYPGAGGGGASAIYNGATRLAEAAGGKGGDSSNDEYAMGGAGGAGGGSDLGSNKSVTGGGAGGLSGSSPTDGGNGQVMITYITH